MAQEPEKTRGDSIDLATLMLAAVSAVVAALVTSRLWGDGALISTALTPVIVTLIKDGLHRPTKKVTTTAARVVPTPKRGAAALAGVGARGGPERERFDERRLREGGGTPSTNGANGAGAPPPPFDDTRSYDPTRSIGDATEDTAPATTAGQPAERKLYGGRRRLRPKVIALTAGAAFVIAVGALTIPELVLGESVGGGDRGTTLFGGEGGGERSGGDADDGGDASGEGSDASEQTPSGSEAQGTAPEEGTESAPEEEVAPEEAEPAPTEPAPAEPTAPE